MAKINYLNNKDLLEEIHRSKSSFCSFTDPKFNVYDLIVSDIDVILDDPETIDEAKKARAKRLGQKAFEAKKLAGEKVKLAECEVDVNTIPLTDLVFRVMTYDHIPLNPTRKKKPKTEADKHDKVNFPAFQHWKFDNIGGLVCVGKSHWKGDLETGEFCKTHGSITNTLAKMYIKLCERYATRGNVRSYTYNDEMKGQAILQLTLIGLQFNEAVSSNPFSYLTTACTNSFVRIINIEKNNQNIRDDLLELHGMNPSYTRTNEDEHNAALKRYNNSDWTSDDT